MRVDRAASALLAARGGEERGRRQEIGNNTLIQNNFDVSKLSFQLIPTPLDVNMALNLTKLFPSMTYVTVPSHTYTQYDGTMTNDLVRHVDSLNHHSLRSVWCVC